MGTLTTPGATDEQPEIDGRPCCAYEVVTRNRLTDLADDVDRVQGLANALLRGAAAAITIDLVLRLAGV